MKVYIAGRFEDRDRISEVKREFEAAEIEVTADWITEAAMSVPRDQDLARRNSALDKRQIAEADIFVLFKPADAHGKTTGGHHFETGFADALGKPIFLIGSAENLFHHGCENVRVFDSTQAAVNAALCFALGDVKPTPHAVDSYQRWTASTALYPGKGEKKAFGATYLAFGLGGESGEVVEKILSHLNAESERLLMSGDQSGDDSTKVSNLCMATQKLGQFVSMAHALEELKRPLREAKMELPDLKALPEDLRVKIMAELGDVAWYLVRMADELGVPFSQVLAGNIEKLMSRKDRNKLHGTGDNR